MKDFFRKKRGRGYQVRLNFRVERNIRNRLLYISHSPEGGDIGLGRILQAKLAG
jgi:hypothetical protein